MSTDSPGDSTMLRAECRVSMSKSLQQLRQLCGLGVRPRAVVLIADYMNEKHIAASVLSNLRNISPTGRLNIIDGGCDKSDLGREAVVARLQLIRDVYCAIPNEVDVNILIDTTQLMSPVDRHMSLLNSSDAIILTPACSHLKTYLLNLPGIHSRNVCDSVECENGDLTPVQDLSKIDAALVKRYDNVVLGGTFDRLHNGHKLFLYTACQLARKKLTIGLTGPSMLRKKTLADVLQPFEYRKEVLEQFIRLTNCDLKVDVSMLADVAGPAGIDGSLELLVATPEVASGVQIINRIRKDNNLSPLDLYITDLAMVSDVDKMSSTDMRRRCLGQLQPRYITTESGMTVSCRTPWLTRWDQLTHMYSEEAVRHAAGSTAQQRSYVIGLTGGIAAGKSNIAKRLEELGAVVIYADQMAHKAYSPGTKLFEDIVQEFGGDIVHENGSINRAALGKIVFSSKDRMNALNQLCWPVLCAQVKDILEKSLAREQTIVVVEAAVLVESGMSSLVDEVWTAMVPHDIAVKRIMERNGLPEDDAEKRVSSQCSNAERLGDADVVFSPLWEKEATFEEQIKPAWKQALQRAKAFHNVSRCRSLQDVCAGLVDHYCDDTSAGDCLEQLMMILAKRQATVMELLHRLDHVLPNLLNLHLVQAAAIAAVRSGSGVVSSGVFAEVSAELDQNIKSTLEIVNDHQHFRSVGNVFDHTPSPTVDSDVFNLMVALRT